MRSTFCLVKITVDHSPRIDGVTCTEINSAMAGNVSFGSEHSLLIRKPNTNPILKERIAVLVVQGGQCHRSEADMLAHETLLQLQKYNFHLLARQEPSGRRRLRYIVLAHIKTARVQPKQRWLCV
jgi:hypothetical protein